MTNGFSRQFAVFAALMGATASISGAQAQQQTAQVSGLEEIVVTARAREERLQDIPLAITAFTADDLSKRVIMDMRDVARMTPGFAFEEYAGSNNTSPVIRGGTQIAGSAEQPVSFFLDGVYLPRSYITDIGFTGIERIEIVKGPQSARYGRNAFMGAVNYITKKPGDEWTAEVKGTLGNYKRYDLGGFVSGPVVADRFGITAGVDFTKFGGSWKNPHPFCDINFSPGSNCRLGGYDKTTWTVGGVITPVDNLDISVNYFNLDSKKEQLAQNVFGELNHDSGKLNCGVFNPTVRPAGGTALGSGGQWFRLYCGQIPVEPVMSLDPRAYGPQLNADILRIGVDYEFNDQLSFSYTYGFVDSDVTTNRFSDFGPTCTYLTNNQCTFSGISVAGNRTESHDGRLTFDDGEMWRVAVGLLYSPYRDNAFNAFGDAPVLTAVPTTPLTPFDRIPPFVAFTVLGQTLTKNKVLSPFAEVGVKLMEGRLRLGAEGRQTRERRYQQALASGGTGGVATVTGAAYKATYKFFTPRFTGEFDLTDNTMVYASAAKGVKSGGFNTTAFLPENRIYEGDKNWTYELGAKNEFGNFRLNGNLFLTKWSNQQIPAADPGNPAVLPIVITRNLGNSTSKGFELEGAWAATDKLTFNGALYYGKATYDQGTFHLNYARTPAVCDNVVCKTNGDISGNQTPRAPRWMSTVGGEWSDEIGGSSDMSYYIRSDVTYQSKSYADEINLAWVPKRFVTNASVGLSGDYYDVQLWFRNLFDKKYAAVASIQQPNVKYDSTLGERRTIGITVSLKFNGGAAPRREPAAAPPPASPPRAAAPPPAEPVRSAPPAPPVPQKFLVFFDFDRSNLRADASKIVSDAASYAKTNGKARIQATGHADTSGPNAYNLGLSQRRAEAVKAELVRLGIPANEIVVLFKGESEPLVATGDGVREPQNRRVEIVME